MNKDTLNKLGNKWLEEKIHRMKNLLKIALPDEALYREIMLSLGYPKNKVQFLELSLLLPFKEIQQLKTQPLIEKALLYRAGFSQDTSGLPKEFDTSLKLDKSYWIYKSIRPANFPDKRIKDISHLLAAATEKGIYKYFSDQIEKNCQEVNENVSSKKVVEELMLFKGVGISRKREMFFNIILPFFLADNNFKTCHNFLMKIFETHPPLDENSIIKKFYNEHEFKITNVKEYFGAIKHVTINNS